MRVTREQAAANREQVVVSAARQFRKHGFSAVSISDVMKAAGLTHGGFYGHFSSKQALESEVCRRGLTESVAAVDAVMNDEPDGVPSADSSFLRRFVDEYVSADHRDAPEDGCTVAALACDAGRSEPEIQKLFVDGITGMAGSLARLRRQDSPDAEQHDVPDLATLSSMVGALVLSRAVASADPALAEEILAATRERIESRAAAPGG
ncbi:TetR/AcrR family transcriptional regulator [Streptomyces sp. NPDC026673]|uniref:TetR/AcrR family transcriptional regulator n=1 Tax=Streptomyces sp. NPDC026673 TaxID=3155724 RepID=UPI0033F844E9